MKRGLLFLYLLFLITVLLSDPSILMASSRLPDKFTPGRSASGFIENKGQIIDQRNKLNPAVLYLLPTAGMNVQLRKGGFSYDLYRISNIDQRNLNNDLKERDEADPRHALPVTVF